MTPEFPELGCYGLAGHTSSPRDLLDEVVLAEQLGLGAVFLSERFDVKDAGVLAGAAAAVTSSLGIGTAATNHNTRHPLVTATMAATAHRLSGGRYALGLGRGFDMLFDLMGLPHVTGAQLEDATGVLRRLWRGEKFAHEGPSGTYPYLFAVSELDERIPVLMVAIGPRSLRLAGRVADAVVLHTFMSDEAVAESVAAVRGAAAEAGRDPASVRIWACTAVVADAVPEVERLRRTVGRLAAYLQLYGEVLVRVNRWDPAALERFRGDPLVREFAGSFDAVATAEQLEYLRDSVIPAEWLATGVTGSARACAERVAGQLESTGVDSVIMHGVPPRYLSDVVAEYRDVRPVAVRPLPANPGWSARTVGRAE